MSRPSLEDVKTLIAERVKDNTVGAITPARLREVFAELADYLDDLEARIVELEALS